jgi:hypothetical protein
MKKIIIFLGIFVIVTLLFVNQIAHSTADALQAKAVITSAESARTMATATLLVSFALLAVVFTLVGCAVGFLVFWIRRQPQMKPAQDPRKLSPAKTLVGDRYVFRATPGPYRISDQNPILGGRESIVIPPTYEVAEETDVEDQLFQGWGF